MGEIRRKALEEMLRGEWRGAMERTLEEMLRDLRAGKIEGDELVKNYDFLRHLMGRREQLLIEIRMHTGALRGPGTPGYVAMYGGRKP